MKDLNDMIAATGIETISLPILPTDNREELLKHVIKRLVALQVPPPPPAAAPTPASAAESDQECVRWTNKHPRSGRVQRTTKFHKIDGKVTLCDIVIPRHWEGSVELYYSKTKVTCQHCLRMLLK